MTKIFVDRDKFMIGERAGITVAVEPHPLTDLKDVYVCMHYDLGPRCKENAVHPNECKCDVPETKAEARLREQRPTEPAKVETR